MEGNMIPVCCYFGGTLIQNAVIGLCYEGGTSHFLHVPRYGTNLESLQHAICDVHDIDRRMYMFRLIFRCPVTLGSGATTTYSPCALDNDDVIQFMLSMPSQYPALVVLEVYVTDLVRNAMSLGDDIGLYQQLLTSNVEPPIAMNPPAVPTNLAYFDAFAGTSSAAGHDTDLSLGMTAAIPPHSPFHQTTFDEHFEGGEDMSEEEISITSSDSDESENEGPIQPVPTESRSQHQPPAQFFMAGGGWGSTYEEINPDELFDPNIDDLSVGLTFLSKETLQRAVDLYHMRISREFSTVESDRKKLSLRCRHASQSGCNWRLRAHVSVKEGCWVLSKYGGQHTCVNASTSQDHRRVTSNLISEIILEKVREQPSYKVSLILQDVIQQFQYTTTYKKAWYGKQHAIARVFGDWEESFNKLPMLFCAIRHHNPGSVAVFQAASHSRRDGYATMRRVFWAFNTSIDGWRHCRPVVTVDGTFLTGKYKAKLLVAMGVDGNKQVYPLAFAVVQEETEEDWAWFLRHLRRYVVLDRAPVTIISDRGTGIIAAMQNPRNGFSEGNGCHRFCLRHIRSNFAKMFKMGSLKKLCWLAGATPQKRKFEKYMKKIQDLNGEAHKYLDDIPREMWTLSHDGWRRCGQLTTNIVECFNGVLRTPRSLPISSCVEWTFYKVNQYFNYSRSKGLATSDDGRVGPYTAYGTELLQHRSKRIGSHRVTLFDRNTGLYEVQTAMHVEGSRRKGGHKHTVNISDRSCTCGKWDVYGVPCGHALAVFRICNRNPAEFVSPFLTVDAYRKSWEPKMMPLLHSDYWNYSYPDEWLHFRTALLPDSHWKRSKRGRRRSTRFRMEMDESNRVVHCSICGVEGHTRNRCIAGNI